MTKLRLIFMGTPDFAVPALAAVIDAGHEVVAVYCQPPRPAGRGQKERLTPVHAFAAARGIAVFTPKSLRTDEAQATFAAHGADAAVVAAYGLILPKAVLDAPRQGCFNIHASLLPRWRGAAPIHRALLAGDAETGVTIMAMDQGLDTGAMLAVERTPITETTTVADLHDGLAAMGAKMMVETLARLSAQTLAATSQPSDGVTYAAKISKAESRIDWTHPADQIARMIRAFTPWPGAYFEHAGQRIKVLAADALVASGPVGTVLDDGLTIGCGQGSLRVRKVQRAGKSPAATDAFLRGYPMPKGTVVT